MIDSNLNSGFVAEENFNCSNRFTDIQLLHTSANGYSHVYRAKRYGRWCILKCLTPQAQNNPRYRTLLEKEFQIAYSLSHPHILHTIGLEEVPTLGKCILYEWIEGSTWQPMNDKQQTRLTLVQLCEAIEYIHALGIVHRDIKPENVMVEKHSGRVVLIDFGLADKAEFSVLKEPAGTSAYMDAQHTADMQQDLYALGCIIAQSGFFASVAKRCQRHSFYSAAQVRQALLRRFPWLWCIVGLLAVSIAVGAIAVQRHLRTQQQRTDAITTVIQTKEPQWDEAGLTSIKNEIALHVDDEVSKGIAVISQVQYAQTDSLWEACKLGTYSRSVLTQYMPATHPQYDSIFHICLQIEQNAMLKRMAWRYRP